MRKWGELFGRSCSACAVTLLPLIAAHMRPGSIVYSNEWSAYNQLAATTSNIHNTVNHLLHFVHQMHLAKS